MLPRQSIRRIVSSTSTASSSTTSTSSTSNATKRLLHSHIIQQQSYKPSLCNSCQHQHTPSSSLSRSRISPFNTTTPTRSFATETAAEASIHDGAPMYSLTSLRSKLKELEPLYQGDYEFTHSQPSHSHNSHQHVHAQQSDSMSRQSHHHHQQQSHQQQLPSSQKVSNDGTSMSISRLNKSLERGGAATWKLYSYLKTHQPKALESLTESEYRSILKSVQYLMVDISRVEAVETVLEDMTSILGISPNVEDYKVLLSAYSFAGYVNECESTLNEMKRNKMVPDSYCFKKLMLAHIRSGNSVKALEWCLEKESKKEFTWDASLYSYMLKSLIRDNELEALDTFLEKMKRMYFPTDILDSIVDQHVISCYLANGDLDAALKSYEDIKHKTDSRKIDRYTYEFLIRKCLAQHKYREKAMEIYSEMQKAGYAPEETTYVNLMNAYRKLGLYEFSVDLFEDMVKSGIRPGRFSSTELMRALCDLNRVEEAMEVLREIERDDMERDIYMYVTLMDGWAKKGDVGKFLELYSELRRKNIPMNRQAYSVLIDGLARNGQIEQAINFMSEMEREGFEAGTIHYNMMMYGYINLGQMEKAKTIFEDMCVNGPMPDIYTYNHLILLYLKNDELNNALEVLELMEEQTKKKVDSNGNVNTSTSPESDSLSATPASPMTLPTTIPTPNLVTYNIFISYFCQQNDVDNAKAFYQKIESHPNLEPNLYTIMVLMDVHASNGDFHTAKEFRNLADHLGYSYHVGPYNVLIKSYLQQRNFEAAMLEFERARRLNIRPDIRTFDMMIRALDKAGEYEKVEALDSSRKDCQVTADMQFYEMRIQHKLEEGNIGVALDTFQEILDRMTTSTWAAGNTGNDVENDMVGEEGEESELLDPSSLTSQETVHLHPLIVRISQVVESKGTEEEMNRFSEMTSFLSREDFQKSKLRVEQVDALRASKVKRRWKWLNRK